MDFNTWKDNWEFNRQGPSESSSSNVFYRSNEEGGGSMGSWSDENEGPLRWNVFTAPAWQARENPESWSWDRSKAPSWMDAFNEFESGHMNKTGIGIDRKWTDDGMDAKLGIDERYKSMVGEWNQANPNAQTQVDQRYLGAVQPNSYKPKPKKSGFGDMLKMVAPIALGAFGGPLIAGALGGGLGGAVGAGALTGGFGSAIQGGDFLTGALKGGISGGFGSGVSSAVGNLAGGAGSGWTSGFDLPMGNFGGSLGGASGGFAGGVPDSYWNQVAGGVPSGGMSNWGGGSTWQPSMDFMGGGGDMDFGDFGDFGNFLDIGGDYAGGGIGEGWDWGQFGGDLPTGDYNQGANASSDWLSSSPDAGGMPGGGSTPWNQGSGFGSQATDMLKKFLTDPKNLFKGGSALANMMIQNRTSNKLMDAANQGAFRNQSLNQAQRIPYQQMLAQQMNNPASFFQSNPVVQAMLERSKAQFEANTAKMGAGGKVFSDYLNSMNAGMGDNYYKNADLLSRLGGFNDGSGGSGSIYGQLAGQSAAARGAGFQGFSQFFNPEKEDPQVKAIQQQLNTMMNRVFL